MSNTVDFTKSLNITNPDPLDAKYGPYTSTSEADTEIPNELKFQGLIVGVIVSGRVVLHIYQDNAGVLELEPIEASAGSGGSVTVPGNDTEIIFNNGGAFAASSFHKINGDSAVFGTTLAGFGNNNQQSNILSADTVTIDASFSIAAATLTSNITSGFRNAIIATNNTDITNTNQGLIAAALNSEIGSTVNSNITSSNLGVITSTGSRGAGQNSLVAASYNSTLAADESLIAAVTGVILDSVNSNVINRVVVLASESVTNQDLNNGTNSITDAIVIASSHDKIAGNVNHLAILGSTHTDTGNITTADAQAGAVIGSTDGRLGGTGLAQSSSMIGVNDYLEVDESKVTLSNPKIGKGSIPLSNIHTSKQLMLMPDGSVTSYGQEKIGKPKEFGTYTLTAASGEFITGIYSFIKKSAKIFVRINGGYEVLSLANPENIRSIKSKDSFANTIHSNSLFLVSDDLATGKNADYTDNNEEVGFYKSDYKFTINVDTFYDRWSDSEFSNSLGYVDLYQNGGITYYSISDLVNLPTETEITANSITPLRIGKKGDYVYTVSQGFQEIVIINTNSNSQTAVSVNDVTENPIDIKFYKDFLLVVTDSHVVVYNISTPTSPTLVDVYESRYIAESVDYPIDIAIKDNYLYLVYQWDPQVQTEDRCEVFNLTPLDSGNLFEKVYEFDLNFSYTTTDFTNATARSDFNTYVEVNGEFLVIGRHRDLKFYNIAQEPGHVNAFIMNDQAPSAVEFIEEESLVNGQYNLRVNETKETLFIDLNDNGQILTAQIPLKMAATNSNKTQELNLDKFDSTKPSSANIGSPTTAGATVYGNPKELLSKELNSKLYTDSTFTIEESDGWFSTELEPEKHLVFYYQQGLGVVNYYEVYENDNIDYYNFSTLNGSYIVIEDTDTNTEVAVIEDGSKLVLLDNRKNYQCTWVSKGKATYTRVINGSGTEISTSETFTLGNTELTSNLAFIVEGNAVVPGNNFPAIINVDAESANTGGGTLDQKLIVAIIKSDGSEIRYEEAFDSTTDPPIKFIPGSVKLGESVTVSIASTANIDANTVEIINDGVTIFSDSYDSDAFNEVQSFVVNGTLQVNVVEA